MLAKTEMGVKGWGRNKYGQVANEFRDNVDKESNYDTVNYFYSFIFIIFIFIITGVSFWPGKSCRGNHITSNEQQTNSKEAVTISNH